ncbi:autotransporter outer membrane beta-barrel domain-containing protein [Shewanella algae]|nr:autotransporter outer membrane beta-barrel domain-containing protein [Shewanella algae]
MKKTAAFILLGAISASTGLLAAEAPTSRYTLSLAAIENADTDIDGGGELGRRSYLLGARGDWQLDERWGLGVSLGYDKLDWDFSALPTNGASDMAFAASQFDSAQRYSASVSLRYTLNRHWSLMLAPQLQYAYSDDVSSSDARSYSVIAGAVHRFNSGNMLGFGVAYLNDISEVRTVPYLLIDWQLSDRWRVGNPFQAGFTGPAGIEFSYRISPEMELGLGSSHRTERILVGKTNRHWS